jgi:O-antigen/teichoic acid export membrane protein
MKINQLKAGVVLSYVSQGINILSGLLYTPIMLRLLGQSEYGLYQFVSSVISYLGLLSFGFGSSYIRYYSKYKINNDNNGIAKLNGLFMVVFTVIGLIAFLTGSVLVINIESLFANTMSTSEIGTAKTLMWMMIINLSVSFPGSVFSSYITANEKYVFQRIINILSGLLNPFLTLPLLFLGYKSISLVIVQTLLSIASLCANIIFCRSKIGIKFDFKKVDFRLLKELFMFSFWIFINQIIDQINWSLDKFVLGVISGTATVAVYGVASQLNTLYISLSAAVSNVFCPRINRIVAKNNDNKELTELFIRVGRIQFIILTLLVSGLIIFGRYFIYVWAGEGYKESYIIALLLLLPVTIPLIQNLGIEIQRAKNMHKFRSIIYLIIAVANIVISIPLAKCFGGTGAAAGTAISLLLGTGLIMNIYYHKKIGLDIISFWKQILRFLPALIPPSLCGCFIIKYIRYDNIFSFVLLIILYTLVYTVSMWMFGMNNYEKGLILKPIKKLVQNGKSL